MFILLLPNTTFGKQVDINAYKHIRFQGVDIPNVTSNIVCVTQDNEGFMWFGTAGYGLIKYDGIRFKYYQNNYLDKHSLITDYINDIYQDSNGNLWILTRNSISVYNSELDRVENLVLAKDFAKILKNVNKVYEDRKGNIFIKGARGIIAINYDRKNKDVTWRHILTYDNDKKRSVFEPVDLCFDENNALLVSANKRLYKKSETDTMLYPAKFNNYPESHPQVYFDDYCNCFTSFKRKLHIIHKNGTSYSDFQKFNDYSWVSSGNESVFSKFHKPVLTEYDRVWTITRSGVGLMLTNEQKNVFKDYLLFNADNSYHYSIKGNTIHDIYKDKDLNYWIATDKGVSVYSYSEARFIYIDNKSFGINPSIGLNIRSMAVTRNHFLWMSVATVGVFVLNEQSNLLYIMPKSILPKVKRYSWITVEDDNNIWIGCNDNTHGGLYHLIVPDDYYKTLDKSILKTKRYLFKDFDVDGDSIPIVRMVKIDSKNNLWVGTANDGLLKIPMKGDGNLDTAKIIHYHKKSDLVEYRIPGNLIHDMCELSDGSYLFSNISKELLKVNSQYKVDTDYKIEYPYSDQANKSVNMIYQDKDDNIWLSTNRYGAVKYNPNTQKVNVVDMSKGLPSNTVFSVMTDPYNRYLINTNRGLVLYYPENESVVRLKTTSDGSEYAFYGPYYKDHRDFYYYSYRGKGMVRIEFKDTTNKKLSSPQLALTGLRINNKSVEIEPNNKTAVLQKAIWQTKKIKLKHFQNNISFEFTSLSYPTSENCILRYKLEGIDDNWTDCYYPQYYANYSKLPGGNFTFKLIGTNKDGVWNKQPLELRVRIIPVFYKTVVFKVLVPVFLVIVVIVFFYWRTLSIRRQNMILENQVQERTEELEHKNMVLANQAEELREINTLLEERQQLVEEQREELRTQTEELLQKKKSLEESNSTKDMLFSIIAHDIKNPFSTVLGFSELLQNKLHDISIEKIQKYIDVVSESSHKIYRLLENLLEWSRAQLGTISIEFEVFKAFKLASEIQSILKDQIQIKNNQLVIECDPDLDLYSDYNLLNTILRNLVSNANKYTEAAKITISFKKDLDRIIICVADQGTGISDELKKDLFKIVKDKSQAGTRGEQGTGLGLVICYEFTLLLKGEIWLESRVGVGTSFYISIPAR